MMDLYVAPDGNITAIYDEAIEFRRFGSLKIARASHVEPDGSGLWFAEIIDGPKLGPFTKRSEALAAEVKWLTEHRLPQRP